MSDAQTDTIDVLDAVQAHVEALQHALEQADVSSTYLDGQQAFFEAALAAIDQAGDEEAPRDVLRRAAERVDLHLDGHQIRDTPLSSEQAGSLAAWGLCLGYADGFPDGARAVVDTVDEMPGVEGAFDDA